MSKDGFRRRRLLRAATSAVILAGSLLAAPTSARATVIVPADLGELSRDALAIARGRVVAVDAQWTPGRRSIETLVTLHTDQYLKGRFGETVQFRVPGGVLGRYRNIVMGAPTFVVGQHVIVFLGAKGPSVPFVLGLSQGVFRVVQGAADSVMVLPPPLVPGVSGQVVRGSAARRPTTLAAFQAEIRALSGGAQ